MQSSLVRHDMVTFQMSSKIVSFGSFSCPADVKAICTWNLGKFDLSAHCSHYKMQCMHWRFLGVGAVDMSQAGRRNLCYVGPKHNTIHITKRLS